MPEPTSQERRLAWMQQSIEAHPGIHHRELARRIGIAPSTAHHHARILLSRGAVLAERDARYVRYFPVTASRSEMTLQAQLARGANRAILRALAESPGATSAQIARLTSMRAPLASVRLVRLFRAGLVERERSGTRFSYRVAPAWEQPVSASLASS